MPVNLPQLQQLIHQMGGRARSRDAERRDALEKSRSLLDQYNNQQDLLRQMVQDAASVNNHLRCAIPGDEALSAAVNPPSTAGNLVLLAADGSQINPSRHDAVQFGVINVGVFRMRIGNAEPPSEITSTQLLAGDELFAEGSDPIPLEAFDMSEELIALRRDLNERRLLAELAQGEEPPVLALTDGPLELFREPRSSGEYDRAFEEYLVELRRLSELNVIAAGYVDRPRADLLVRLLELLLIENGRWNEAGRVRPLKRVLDAHLFHAILQPGQRSAVFGIQSPSTAKFTEDLALHFFYLNVGRAGRPALARVEIPAWVARARGMVDLLHAALLAQCRLMGSRPYPYALHRAHETAVVTFAEKERIEEMMVGEYLRQGISVEGRSNKQSAKDLPGRTPLLP